MVAWTVSIEGIPLPTVVLDLPVLHLRVVADAWGGLTSVANAVAG